jgi:phage repressor protein C with HTH and peptisase S24 domain
MAPTLHDGDLVMIDERRTQVRSRRVYALIDTDGAARVKRLDVVPDQLIILTSDNPAHPAETRQGPDMNRLRILGEIVWSAHAW